MNGEFRLTAAVSGGFPVYEMMADTRRSIWHVGETGKWMDGDTKEIGENIGFASLKSRSLAPTTRGTGDAKWRARCSLAKKWCGRTSRE